MYVLPDSIVKLQTYGFYRSDDEYEGCKQGNSAKLELKFGINLGRRRTTFDFYFDFDFQGFN